MKTALIAILGILLATSVFAQQTATPAPRPTVAQPRIQQPAVTQPQVQEPAPGPPQPPAMPVNVRIDVAVIDTRNGMSKREVVTLTSADRESAYSRAGGRTNNNAQYQLNIDATPFVSGMPTGKVRVRLSLAYAPARPEGESGVANTQLQFSLVLDDGKMIVASDTTDPASDRRVRIEVTATILK